MPSLGNVIKRFTKQKLVYWRKIASDNFGQPTYAEAVELKCRWEDTQKEIILPDGRTVLSKGYILLASNLEVGSLVFLGTIDQDPKHLDRPYWKGLPNYPKPPTVLLGGREIMKSNATPDLNATSFVYEAYI